MWSLLRNLGETLRLLAPAALLAILCGRDSPVIKFFQQFDRALRNALFPPPSQIDNVLKWLRECLPEDKRLTSLNAIWNDGTIICDLLNSVIPGACSGHDDKGADLAHGQRIVEQYLGVSPIFSDEDLSQKTLSSYQECRLSHYMCRIREAISQMSPPVSRAGTPLLNVQAYTFDYVARGMGIFTAYKGRKASFYIYPTAQQSLEPGDISIQIKGPGTCYGSAVVPAIYGRTHIIRNVILNLGKKQSFSHLPSPLIQGASYMRDYNTDVQTKYFIPKLKNEIDMKIFVKNDRVKVSYTPTLVGLHEISLISKGCHIIGSPFEIHVEVALAHKQDSTDYTDEDPNETTTKADRKVVFSVVDFVTEKMILTEDGRLEKISNEDADLLLRTKGTEELTDKYLQLSKKLCITSNPDIIDNDTADIKLNQARVRFQKAVQKIITMLDVCREFKKQIMKITFSRKQYSQMHIMTPDVVNSTISDASRFNESEDKEYDDKRENANILRRRFKSGHSSFNTTTDEKNQSEDICDDGCLCNAESIVKQKSNIGYDGNEPSSSESTNNHSEDRKNLIFKTGASIDIIISSFDDDDDDMPVPHSLPPLDILPTLEEIPERPKTPVFSVLQNANEDVDIAEVEKEKRNVELDGDFSLDYYINFDENSRESDAMQKLSIDSDEMDNGRISPSINFHIGEPVTPTRMLTPIEPDMDSILLASNLEEALVKYDLKLQRSFQGLEHQNSQGSDSPDFMTPMRQTPFEDMTDSEILKMYEDAFAQDDQVKNNLRSNGGVFNNLGSLNDFNVQKGGVNIMRKQHEARNVGFAAQDSLSSNEEERESNFFDTSIDNLDSAYISIDEVNSSPDTNNTPRSDLSPRLKLYAIQETSHEGFATPTWEMLDGIEPERRQTWKTRMNGEMQKEKEFNEACNGSNNSDETNFHPKTLKLYTHRISMIVEDDLNANPLQIMGYDSSNDEPNKSSEKPNNLNTATRYNNKNDFSASDVSADVKQSVIGKTISTIQNEPSELNREKIIDNTHNFLETRQQTETNHNENIFENKETDDEIYSQRKEKPRFSKMVSEKKEYWDDKIKVLQNENSKQKIASTATRKKYPHIKRNDSLSKKKGRQAKSQNITEIWKNSFELNKINDPSANNHSLVAKWKEYWNERIENLNNTDEERLKMQRIKFQSMYHSDESMSTPEDNMRNDEYSTNAFLGLSKEKGEHYHASTNNEKSQSILENKYQPTPINLHCVTERIEKFLESLPAASPVNELDESRIATPENLFGGIVSKTINKFDRNNNQTKNEKILKVEQEKDKIKIVWNDCQSKKRIEALQKISTPDVLGHNFKDSTNISQRTPNEIINSKTADEIVINNSEKLQDKEDLESFPKVSEIKAKIESLNENYVRDARQNFLKHKSKTFDASKSDKIITLKKSLSMSKMDKEVRFAEPEDSDEVFRPGNISEIKKAFERNLSRENINLNISTESIPSIKNRKLRLEKHLQMVQQNIAIREKEHKNAESDNHSDVNNVSASVEMKKTNDGVQENQLEEIVVFKPVGDIVKAFEEKLSPEHLTKEGKDLGIKANVKEEKTERSLENVAEKGEGTKDHHKQETFLLAKHLDHIEPITDKEGKETKCSSITNTVSQCKANITQDEETEVTPIVTDLEEVKSDYEYKDRFKQAKNFFRHLDKIQKEITKIPEKKLNECELLLLNKTDDEENKKADDIGYSLEQSGDGATEDKIQKTVPPKPVRKFPRRFMTTPVSDSEYEFHKRALERLDNGQPRLRKISETFMVEGLFKDVVGDLNTLGYGFKGIPHKNAVLATFRSMESVDQPSSYEMTTSQMEDFAKKNGIVNAQTYHTDFPHLPTTEPNKYRARYDAVASGMINRKDLLKTQKLRRYSEPSRPRLRLEYVAEI